MFDYFFSPSPHSPPLRVAPLSNLLPLPAFDWLPCVPFGASNALFPTCLGPKAPSCPFAFHQPSPVARLQGTAHAADPRLG